MGRSPYLIDNSRQDFPTREISSKRKKRQKNKKNLPMAGLQDHAVE
jgi:hypothetical protein